MTTPAPGRGTRTIALLVGTAFLMEQLDTAAISVAIPRMAEELGESPARLSLAITVYLLVVAMLIPISGWMADRFGARRVFVAAVGVFGMGSVLCAMADGIAGLAAARVLQGIGGAMMAPVGRLIVLRCYDRSQLVNAIALMTMPVIIGPLIGPALGGVMVQYASWRWIFLLNVPVAIILALTATRVLPDLERRAVKPIDRTGFLLCALALAALMMGAENLSGGYVAPIWSGVLFGVFVAGVLLFTAHARRVQHPVLRPALLANRSFRIGVLTGGLSRLGLHGVIFLAQMQLQLGFGYDPVTAGSIILFSALGSLAIKPVTVRLIRHFGFRAILAGNAAIGAALTCGFAAFDASAPVAVLAVYLAAFGAVRSFQFNATNALTYSELPVRRQSAGISLAGVMQQVSMSGGVSVAAGVVAVAVGGAVIGGAGDPEIAARLSHGFLVLGGCTALAAALFLGLEKSDGAAVVRAK